jgi:hypothetical protein
VNVQTPVRTGAGSRGTRPGGVAGLGSVYGNHVPRVKAQMQLDRWWESQRDLDWEEQDVYFVGGFMERHSQTPGFHKHRRDRDWRVR